MIVVCDCGQKSRIRKLVDAERTRCAACKTNLGFLIHRQAERNAAIVLEVASVLLENLDSQPAFELIAQVFARHQKEARA